jgi:hypothetical protein
LGKIVWSTNLKNLVKTKKLSESGTMKTNREENTKKPTEDKLLSLVQDSVPMRMTAILTKAAAIVTWNIL